MKIKVYWENVNIMEIQKENELFFNQINIEGIKEARRNGMPLFIIRDSVCVSKSLPYFVKRRIYDLKNPEKTPRELEMEIVNKVEETHQSVIKSPTDKVRINIEI